MAARLVGERLKSQENSNVKYLRQGGAKKYLWKDTRTWKAMFQMHFCCLPLPENWKSDQGKDIFSLAIHTHSLS